MKIEKMEKLHKLGKILEQVKIMTEQKVGKAYVVEDLKELKEEGIDAQMIPWIDSNEN